MGGEPLEIQLEEWLGLPMDDWEIAIATPDLAFDTAPKDFKRFTLKDSQGILFERKK